MAQRSPFDTLAIIVLHSSTICWLIQILEQILSKMKKTEKKQKYNVEWTSYKLNYGLR